MSYTIALIASLARCKSDSQEIALLEKIINSPDFNKEVGKELRRIKSFLLKAKGLSTISLANLDKIFVERVELIQLCEKLFPLKIDLALDILHNIKDEKGKMKKFRTPNVKGYDPSVSYLLDYFATVMIEDQKRAESKKFSN